MHPAPVPAPLPAASVIPVRDAGDGVEVLMVRRPSVGAFGGLHVFPGGKVDAGDSGPLARRAVAESDPQELPWRAAALRELVEEVGLVLSDPPLPSASVPRHDVFAGVVAAGARLDPSRLVYVSTWVTPPSQPARFHTRFYLARLGRGADPEPAPGEVEQAVWVDAREALGRGETGQWRMVQPTLAHLRLLAAHATVDGLLASLPDPADLSSPRGAAR